MSLATGLASINATVSGLARLCGKQNPVPKFEATMLVSRRLLPDIEIDEKALK